MKLPTGAGAGARPVITGRGLVFGGVVVLLVVLLASPIHQYLASRSELSNAGKQLGEDQRQLADLQRQKAMWSDPGYVQQQARARLQYAMPGDTVYVVVNKGQSSDIQRTAGLSAQQPASPAWNSRLMDSVRAASK